MASGKPTASATRRADGEPRLALHGGDAEAGDRAELRADHHRADDQDRRVLVDADRGEQPRQDHEGEVDAGELDVLRRPLLDLLPHHGVGRRAARALLDRSCRAVGDLRVDDLERDRAVVVDAELLEVVEQRRSRPRARRRRGSRRPRAGARRPRGGRRCTPTPTPRAARGPARPCPRGVTMRRWTTARRAYPLAPLACRAPPLAPAAAPGAAGRRRNLARSRQRRAPRASSASAVQTCQIPRCRAESRRAGAAALRSVRPPPYLPNTCSPLLTTTAGPSARSRSACATPWERRSSSRRWARQPSARRPPPGLPGRPRRPRADRPHRRASAPPPGRPSAARRRPGTVAPRAQVCRTPVHRPAPRRQT